MDDRYPEHICRDGYADWGSAEDCMADRRSDMEPDDYRRCRDCYRQWETRFIDDTGLCDMCRMPVIVLPSNPLLAP